MTRASQRRILLLNHLKWRDGLSNAIIKVLLEQRYGYRVVLAGLLILGLQAAGRWSGPDPRDQDRSGCPGRQRFHRAGEVL